MKCQSSISIIIVKILKFHYHPPLFCVKVHLDTFNSLAQKFKKGSHEDFILPQKVLNLQES